MTEHREQRELLGAYALGHLPPALADPLRAHLDGCGDCRAELAEIAPLRAELDGIEADRLTSLVTPPPELGERIRTAVAGERTLVVARETAQRRRGGVRRSLLTAAAGVVVLAAGVGIGTAVDGGTAPPAVPIEQLALVPAVSAAPTVTSAGLVAHTWGVEVKVVATGFRQGEVYRAAVRTSDGSLVPAGEFLGVGDKTLTCNLQAALLRPDATGFVITDAAGAEVLRTDL